MIVGMNHFTVIAEDEAATLAFFVDLLGLSVGPRPDLGFPGAWLYAGGPHAVLHMYFGRPMPTQRAGVIDHMAFSATNLRAVKERFDARGLKYDLRQQVRRDVAVVLLRPERGEGGAGLRCGGEVVVRQRSTGGAGARNAECTRGSSLSTSNVVPDA